MSHMFKTLSIPQLSIVYFYPSEPILASYVTSSSWHWLNLPRVLAMCRASHKRMSPSAQPAAIVCSEVVAKQYKGFRPKPDAAELKIAAGSFISYLRSQILTRPSSDAVIIVFASASESWPNWWCGQCSAVICLSWHLVNWRIICPVSQFTSCMD